MNLTRKIARGLVTLGAALAANETAKAIAVRAVLAATRSAAKRIPAAQPSAKPPALRPEDALYTLAEVASELRISEATLRRFLPTVRGLTKFRIGRRMLLDARGVALIRRAMEVPDRMPASRPPRLQADSVRHSPQGTVIKLAGKTPPPARRNA